MSEEDKIRKIVKFELDKVFDKKIKDVKNSIDKDIEKIKKEKLSAEDVKDVIAKAFIRQYKFMWEKGKFITSYLKDV